MDFEVGAILAGKVTGITKFGAFVTVAPGKFGLVHISEIASTYVSDIREHLTEGQDVMVKVIGVDKNGRMNLSIKSASLEPLEARQRSRQRQQVTPLEPSFEDKLKRFMQDSDSKMSGIKNYPDKKGARRRGR